MNIIVGTAGHIDHGKTALVKTLTGTDTDRLPEEKKRGITIDLGFAELDLGDTKIGFVDVPGHERFVKNMLAGASGIDLVLLVIAGDEGVMPQTREHFEICRLLDTKCGIIVLTKSDLIEKEFLDLVKMDVAELVENSFLETAPVVSVSSKTGEGLNELRKTLAESISRVPNRKSEFVTRLWIDRKFTVKGFGAVVTGTLASGEIREGVELELHPVGKKVRVRGVQTHGKDVGKASGGQRTAVNLGGIDHSEIERGMVLCEPGVLRPTYIFEAEVEVIADSKGPLKSRQRVRVHIGTVEVLARIQVLNSNGVIDPGTKDFVQIRLEKPITLIPRERFILRQYSPQITIGGGAVLDGFADKRKKNEIESARHYLGELISAERENNYAKSLKLFIENSKNGVLTFSDFQSRTGWKKEVLTGALLTGVTKKSIMEFDNNIFIAQRDFDDLKSNVLTAIEKHHKNEPLSPGLPRETLRENVAPKVPVEVFKAALEYLADGKKILVVNEIVKGAAFNQNLSKEELEVKQKLLSLYVEAGLLVPSLEDALEEGRKDTKVLHSQARKIFQLLVNSGELVKVTENFYFGSAPIEQLIETLKSYAESKSNKRMIGVPEFKDLAGISRKYAIPLLEYFDSRKITSRAGDKRRIL